MVRRQRHVTPAGRRVLTRRTLLADLGRVTVGAVVLGAGMAACDDEGDEAAGGASPDSGGDATTSGGASASGELAWERASFGFVSAYVLVRGGEAMVFDTGTGDDGVGAIADALAAAGVGWPDVSTVLVSHDHGDHIGGVEAVMGEATGATAHASGADFGSLQSRVDGAAEVTDGDELLGIRVVATPGHTPGHVSAFDPGSGLLLTGDALVNSVQIGGTAGDGIEVSPPDFTADAEAAASSVAVLADLGPTTMLFGHGDPVTDGIAEQLSTYAETL